MIEVCDLTKRYGTTRSVDHLSFGVQAGKVTGFLGPNGRRQVDHDAADLGVGPARHRHGAIGGRPYRELAEPPRVVGALLEARAVHSGRSAYNHLLVLAQTSVGFGT